MRNITDKFSFETPPPPITEEGIKSTQISDVMVVGAGISGLMAALAAAENKASVSLIEKSDTFSARGGDARALYGRGSSDVYVDWRFNGEDSSCTT